MAQPTRHHFVCGSVPLMLDLVRALAALMVVAGHLVQLGIYRGPWPFDKGLQHIAVILFFVLSGLVIANSTKNRTLSASDYAIARITRIVPVAILAIAAGIIAQLIVTRFGAPDPTRAPELDRISARTVLTPMFFLSESWFGAEPVANSPYWSLCYEVWYYILFGLAHYLRGKARIALLAVAAVIAGPRILLLMPVWYAGVWLARRRFGEQSPAIGITNVAVALALLVGVTQLSVPVMFALTATTGLASSSLGFSLYFLTDWATAPVVVLLFVGLRPLALRFAGALESLRRPIELIAGSSFTLYVMHWPGLTVLRGLGFRIDTMTGWMILMIALQLGALVIAQVAEAQRYSLRRTLLRMLSTRTSANPPLPNRMPVSPTVHQ